MKKLVFAFGLVALLLSLSLPLVMAGMTYEDPALCVEGKWLLVNAAHPAGIKVTVPEDARYGNQQQGGCAAPGPNVPMIQVVKERGEKHLMHIWVDGKQATTPTVVVSYGDDKVQTKANNGKGGLNFTFFVK